MSEAATLGAAQPIALAAPDIEKRGDLRNLDRSEATHRRVMSGLGCMQRVEAPVFSGHRAALSFPVRLAAWNLERCYFPAESAGLLLHHGVDVALLSEMDCGMARTLQRHTAADIADRLDMSHAYAVEFLELGLGSANELEHCRNGFNASGFHGNALLAATALHAPVLIRLDEAGHWFRPASREMRIGGRCAVAAAVPTAQGPLYCVSVHLESDADAGFRGTQMHRLFEAIDQLAEGLPVVIGGDLNTGLSNQGDFDAEPLFAEAAHRGYLRHSGDPAAPTTRASMISPRPAQKWKLDWFLTRGVAVAGSVIVPALSDDARPLSDHELIVLELSGLERA